MQIPIQRRAALRLAAAAVVAPAAFAARAQQDYPDKPVQLVVAYPAGGGTDTLARIVAAALEKELGQNVIVINRPGASGLIGTSLVARAAPDGYTLLLDTCNATLRPAIEPTTPFKPSDFVPVSLLTESPLALAVSSSVPVNNLQELLAYSREHARQVNYASTGPGSPQNLVSELMKVKAGLDWVQVPYQGGAPALTDLVAGRVQVMFSNPVPLMAYAGSGHLKVLAVTSAQRLPALAQVPTMQEAGLPDFVIGFWNGVLAPAGTPAAVADKLGAALLKVMAQPKVTEALVRQGSVPMPLGPKEFAAYMARDSARWKAVASAIHYRPVAGTARS
jgi:tripartite-type tricarboxylate transporter receptor subunit TctC